MLGSNQQRILDRVCRERVIAGAAFLEFNVLWWFGYTWLDLAKLNVERPESTVLGLIFHNDYQYGLQSLGLNHHQASNYGLAPVGEFSLCDPSVIEAEWVRQIKRRRVSWWIARTVVPFCQGTTKVISL